MKHHSAERENDSNLDFVNSGGNIVEYQDDGQPKRWRCGKNEKGEKVDPSGINGKDVLHRLDNEGRWEGLIPDPEDFKEQDVWSEN